MQEYTEIVKKFYYKDKYTGAVQELGWSGVMSQWTRFRVICDIISNYGAGTKKPFSLLDVGCGYADLLFFVLPTKYVGIDMRPEAIQIAQEKLDKLPFKCDDGASVFNKHIDEVGPGFDYGVASGIFCHNFENWPLYTQTMIEKMLDRCDKVIVNFLSNPASPFPEMRSTTPEEVTALIDPQFKITLYKDYLPNDFTLLIERQ